MHHSVISFKILWLGCRCTSASLSARERHEWPGPAAARHKERGAVCGVGRGVRYVGWRFEGQHQLLLVFVFQPANRERSKHPQEEGEQSQHSKNSRLLSTSARRIQKELADITLDPPPNCSAGPEGDNIYQWKVHHPRAPQLRVRGRRVLPRYHVHTRVPLQASKGYISDKNLSL